MSKVGYIYKITCKDDSITEYYVGSTNDINNRRYDHKSCCNNPNNRKHNQYKYQFIRENGGWDNFTLKKIKTVHYDDKTELLNKERQWVERLGATLNKEIPSRTYKEWYNANKDTVLEQQKQYRETHKEAIRARDKQYYADNKVAILAKKSEKHDCPCGGRYTHCQKARHLKTEKHQTYLSSQSTTANNSDSDSD